MSFSKIAELHHKLNRAMSIDRDSFFGRLEILEWACEDAHNAIGERWRKLGRYGNIVVPSAFTKALEYLHKDLSFTKEEMTELYDWIKGQCESYGNPDQAVAYVMLDFFIKENYPIDN